jgi:hypothetical protein
MKCYYASFNVGNVEVWGTDLYLDKNSVSLEIEASKDEIFERIDDFSLSVTEEKLDSIWNEVISNMKKYGMHKDKINELDFFILEQPILEKFERCN